MAFLAMAASPTAGAAEPPVNAAPFADFELDAGSSVFGAFDLDAYFDAGAGESLSYRAIAVGEPASPSGAIVDFRVQGSTATIVAADPYKTGSENFAVEACVVGAAPPACTMSNEFAVRVRPGLFGRPSLNPVGTGISAGYDLAAVPLGETVQVSVELPFLPSGDVEWFVDGTSVGTGLTATFVAADPGPHEIKAVVPTDDGPVTIQRSFQVVGPLPAKGLPQWLVPFGVAMAGLAGATVAARSARVRRPVLLLVIGTLYPRLKPESLLDHFTRGALYQLIKEEPGIHFSELRRRADCSHGGAVHHLRVLEQAGYIRAQTTGAYTRFFITGQKLEDDTYGLTPTERAIYSAVVGRPGISQAELSLKLQRSHGTVSRGVTRLVNLGFVTTGRSMRKRLVYPRPEGPLNGPAPEAPGGQVKR